MVVRKKPAPPTPWSKNLAEPKVAPSAYVHSFSNIIGDVSIGENVMIAPGTSIRADEGFPFYIGNNSNVQDGVVIHGLEEGRVKGDDGRSYSVWIGKDCSIAHMALIHGPAYVGDNCFIGFRSTVFNARVGDGCIVMMHVLVQDVEIPSGKYIPSGSIITNQQQADRLPDVNQTDLKFTSHVIAVNQSLKAGYKCSEDAACIAPVRTEGSGRNGSGRNRSYSSSGSTSLSSEVVDQVHQLLSQGYKISTEHADKRRFKVSSWKSGPQIDSTHPSEVIAALEAALADNPGEYVRLLGIDADAKRRVLEEVIQTPEGAVQSASNGQASARTVPPSYESKMAASSSSGSGNLSELVRDLINQGCVIGTEYADKRRFSVGSWRNGPTISSNQVVDVVRKLEAIMEQHPKDYIRIIGIDPNAKRRITEEIIQRPGEKSSLSVAASPSLVTSTRKTSSYSSGPVVTATAHLDAEVVDQVRNLLSQGYKIGTEHADKRRFKVSSWHSCSPIESNRDAEVLAALEACMQEHSGEYVRLIGIDPKAKRRVLETVIQKPA